MLSPLLKTAIFLGLSLLANARPQAFNVQSDGFTIGKVDDWVSSGNYLIYSCSSRAPGIKDLLVDSYLYLQNAILSTDTAPYKAFFHNAYPVPITQVLRHMADGTNMTDVVLKSSRPTIVCANPTDPGLSTAWKLCSEADNRILLQPPGTAYVFLCPSFFDKKRTPEHSDCATVSPDRTRLLMQTHIAQSQYGFLVHALADMYIRKITHFGHAREPDVREVNKCLALPPEKALRNPSSYAIYASNVRAQCTDFPDKLPVERDRELMAITTTTTTTTTADPDAIIGNGMSILTDDCGSDGGNSTSCSS